MHMLNWVDVVMLAILGLGINSGRKSDFFTELVILIGTILAACFSLHYYVRFGNVLNANFVLPKNSQEVLAFVLIAGVIVGITLLAKGGWLVILKINLKKEIDNWGSLVLALTKSIFLCSLVLFTFIISGRPAIQEASAKSFSFMLFKKPALGAYSVFYTGFIAPFFKEELLNQKAFRATSEAPYARSIPGGQ